MSPPKRVRAHTGVCAAIWMSRQDVSVCLHREGCVKVCTAHPHTKVVGRRPQVTPPSSTLGACGGWGSGTMG